MRALLALAALTIAALLAPAQGAETAPARPTDQHSGPAAAGPAAPTPRPASGAPAKPAGKTPGAGSGAAPAPPGAGKTAAPAAYEGPTELDIRAAYSTRIERINSGSERYLNAEAAARLRIRLVKVDIIECTEAEGHTDLYLCNVIVESAVGNADPEFKRVEAVLAKTGKAWTVR